MRRFLFSRNYSFILKATCVLITIGSLNTFASQPASANDCTKSALSKLSQSYGSGYNYMILNNANASRYNLKGVVKRNLFRCGGRTYNYWVFRSGRFINDGDGGWINWAFSGRYNRTGNDVTFYSR